MGKVKKLEVPATTPRAHRRHFMLLLSINSMSSLTPTHIRGPPSATAWLTEWRRLVSAGTITSTATSDGKHLRFGIRLDGNGEPVEFCTNEDTGEDSLPPGRTSNIGSFGNVILRATRALRPPPAARLGSLPPHDEATCSFCTGPLRLEIRPMVAQAVLVSNRVWDVHYNIAPSEPGGHFLLVPEISIPSNRRQQKLLPSDCTDIVELGRACEGELCFNYNSPNAGASQNHLHLHAWVVPTPYAVTSRPVLPDSTVTLFDGAVEASVLDWPAACVRVRGGTSEQSGAVLSALCNEVPTHNIVVLGGDAYAFLRSVDGEVSDGVPFLKMGACQLLGHFIVDTNAQFDAASRESDGGIVERCLLDTRGVAGSATALEEPRLLLERIARQGVTLPT